MGSIRRNTGLAPIFAVIITSAALLGTPDQARAQNLDEATLDGLVLLLETVSDNILGAAQQVPDDQYGFRPTDDVRTLGELFSHVADAHFAYCSAIGGQPQPEAAGMEAMSKSEIVARFRASREYCFGAYAAGAEAGLAQTINVFGNESSRVWTMMQNVAHDNLHYGNIVTYMREIGLVPPSSQ